MPNVALYNMDGKEVGDHRIECKCIWCGSKQSCYL